MAKAREYIIADVLRHVVSGMRNGGSLDAVRERFDSKPVEGLATLEEVLLEASDMIDGLADLAYSGTLRKWQFGEHCAAAKQLQRLLDSARLAVEHERAVGEMDVP